MQYYTSYYDYASQLAAENERLRREVRYFPHPPSAGKLMNVVEHELSLASSRIITHIAGGEARADALAKRVRQLENERTRGHRAKNAPSPQPRPEDDSRCAAAAARAAAAESRAAAAENRAAAAEARADAAEQRLATEQARADAAESEVAAAEERAAVAEGSAAEAERRAHAAKSANSAFAKKWRTDEKNLREVLAINDAEISDLRERNSELAAARDAAERRADVRVADAAATAVVMEYVHHSERLREMVLGDLGVVNLCIQTLRGVKALFREGGEENEALDKALEAVLRSRAEAVTRTSFPSTLAKFFSGMIPIVASFASADSKLATYLTGAAREARRSGKGPHRDAILACVAEYERIRDAYMAHVANVTSQNTQ